jgi:hypothetical protein
MTDDGGVLGNLPRSRPGHRSDKRTGKTAAATRAVAGKRPERAATPPPPVGDDSAASRAGDPVGHAIRAAAGVASTGARVAGGVAREVLRRLPRP